MRALSSGSTCFQFRRIQGTLGLEALAFSHLARLFWGLARTLANQCEPLPELPIRWGARRTTRRMYAAMCEIPLDISKDELDRRVQAFGAGHLEIFPTLTPYTDASSPTHRRMSPRKPRFDLRHGAAIEIKRKHIHGGSRIWPPHAKIPQSRIAERLHSHASPACSPFNCKTGKISKRDAELAHRHRHSTQIDGELKAHLPPPQFEYDTVCIPQTCNSGAACDRESGANCRICTGDVPRPS